MQDLTRAQLWGWFWTAAGAEYGCLLLTMGAFGWGFAGSDSGGAADAAFLLFALAAAAALIQAWRIAGRLASSSPPVGYAGSKQVAVPVLFTGAVVFLPVFMTGSFFASEGNTWLLLLFYGLPIALAIRRIGLNVGTLPGGDSNLVAPSVRRRQSLRELAASMTRTEVGLAALLGVGVLLWLTGPAVRRIHGPVSADSVATSLGRAASDAFIGEDAGRCKQRGALVWECEVGNQTGQGNFSYRVTFKAESSCWTAVMLEGGPNWPLPSGLDSCVRRFQNGWQDVFGV